MSAGGGWFAVYRSILKKYEGDADGLAGLLVVLAWTRFQRDGDLERGEVRISTRKLAEQLGWSHSKARRFINRLIRGGEIRHTNRHTNRHTQAKTFLVVRYSELQPSDNGPGTPTGTPTGTLVRRKKKAGKKKRVSENLLLEGVRAKGASP